jgi:hypothetical protein
MELTTTQHEQLQELLQRIAKENNITIPKDIDYDIKADSFYYDIVTSIEDCMVYLETRGETR